MTERKPPVIKPDTPIGPDVDLKREDVRLANGARLTKPVAARIVEDVHHTTGASGGGEPELVPLRELLTTLLRELRKLRLPERAGRAIRHLAGAIESHNKVR